MENLSNIPVYCRHKRDQKNRVVGADDWQMAQLISYNLVDDYRKAIHAFFNVLSNQTRIGILAGFYSRIF